MSNSVLCFAGCVYVRTMMCSS